jgi:hypothetical protein
MADNYHLAVLTSQNPLGPIGLWWDYFTFYIVNSKVSDTSQHLKELSVFKIVFSNMWAQNLTKRLPEHTEDIPQHEQPIRHAANHEVNTTYVS